MILGALLGLYMRFNDHLLSSEVNQSLSLLGLTLILCAIFGFNETTPFPGFYALIPTVGTCLVILCTVPQTFAYKLLSFKPIVGLGLTSYSTYLWHQPIFSFAKHKIGSVPSDSTYFLLCVISILLGWISWRVVELPFRDSNQIKYPLFIKTFAGALVVLLVMGSFIHYKSGYFNYFNSKNEDIWRGDIGHEPFLLLMQDTFERCLDEGIRERAEIWYGINRCNQTSRDAPTVAVFGDSHAEHLFFGLATGSSHDYIQLIRGGHSFAGEQTHQYLIDYINKNREIETVVFSAYWQYEYSVLGAATFREKFLKTIKSFLDADKNLILIADVPDFKFDAKSCYYRARFNSDSVKCNFLYEEFDSQRKYLDIFYEYAQYYDYEIIDPSPLFCGNGTCSMMSENTIMYRDSHHLNVPGSTYVGEFIINRSRLINQK